MGKYRLTALFGLAAMLFVLTAALVISYSIGKIAENNLIRIAERTIAADAVHMLSMIQQPSKPLTMEALADSEGLPRHLPMLVREFSIVKLNLVDPQGRLVWSTDRGSIGTFHGVDPTFAKSLDGRISSKFLPNQELAELNGVRPSFSVVQTSLPLRDSSTGQVFGVLEIFRNVTDDVPFIIGATKSSVLKVTATTMSGLFLVLLTVVVAADVIISRSKEREQITLEN